MSERIKGEKVTIRNIRQKFLYAHIAWKWKSSVGKKRIERKLVLKMFFVSAAFLIFCYTNMRIMLY